MGEGVVPNVVTLGDDALYQIRMGLGIVADDEEARLDVLLLQDVEDLRRPVGIRPVVEGESKLARLGPGPLNYIGRGDLCVGLVDNAASILINFQGPRSGSGPLGDAQDFALSLKIDVFAVSDNL